MYIIVSTDPRVPLDLTQGFQIEQWTPNEFFTKASDEEGLDIDEGIWYDVADLTAEIYEGLTAYIEAGVNIIYYRFDDRMAPSFTITQEVKVYPTVAAPQSEPVMVEPEPFIPEQPQIQPMPEPEPEPIPAPAPTPVPEPVYTPPVQQQTVYTPPVQPQSVYTPPVQPVVQPQPVAPRPTSPIPPVPQNFTTQQMQTQLGNMLQYDDYDAGDRSRNRKAAPAKVILFGSSKGGTGKTFTCLISAYWYAKSHPTQKIALADFDIIDGQIGITINKLTPTMQDYYKLYRNEQKDYMYLDNCKVKSANFSPNIDFYLAPSQDIPTITNDNDFWNDIFNKLISNYDVVFFDSGIDYIGKLPISQLYKIADKIIITCNPSINSVKSVIKQFKTLSGQRQNNIFRPGDKILEKINVVLTRIDKEDDNINDIVRTNITKYVPIIAQFGQIDSEIKKVQWYQQWTTIDTNSEITEQLDKIITF